MLSRTPNAEHVQAPSSGRLSDLRAPRAVHIDDGHCAGWQKLREQTQLLRKVVFEA